MKFGKEFTAQMVQEWQAAYMDYNYLKTILKDILRFRQQRAPSPVEATSSHGGLQRRASLYRAFSGLTSKYRGSPRKNEEETILVSAAREDGNQTMFLRSSEEGGESELVFFKRLDDEFNKVVKFYKGKVEEVMVEADELSRQMNALIALRIKVEDPLVGGDAVADLAALPGGSTTSTSVLERTNGRKPGGLVMDAIQEVEMIGEVDSDEPNEEKREDDEEKTLNQKKDGGGKADIQSFKPPQLEVLDHVKINIEPDTPLSTLKGLLMCSTSGRSFSKHELRKTEELMSRAFVVFYQKLRLLKSYCFLNQLAFSKILKKYDKITSRNASKSYLRMVDNSYLGSSDEVTKLMERVEATFVKHFTNGNHRKGVNILRPKTRREKHRITYLLGFLSGFAIALAVAIIVLIHARDVLKSPGRNQYMENIFPLYSLFGFIALHWVMYAGNIYFWKRYRINYSFIFGFKQGRELGYREVLLLSSGLAVLTLAGVISNLDMEMDPRTKSFRALTELVPFGLLLVVLLITFCPLNILYRSSRYFLIQCAFHSICAPLYKVTLPDFFLADQLTSQVQAFRSLEFYVCYYGWGDFERRSNNCQASRVYRIFYLIVAVIPYWFRFAQCLRHLLDDKDSMHLLNGLKYFSTIVAVAMRTIYDLRRGTTWLIMAAATSGVATIASTYWDIVIDWGLLRRNSSNPWLRDKLSIPKRSVYFLAMVLNVLLRLAWMQSVLGIREAPFLHRTALTALVASLEIIRRGIWNFFRLENEHFNNVGKYRAFKSVPLPFHYDYFEGKSL